MKDEQQSARWVRFAIIGCPAYAAGHLSQVNAAALCSAIDKGEAEPDRLLASTLFHDASRQCRFNRSTSVSKSQEKRLNRIAEHKGFRLDKAGKGTAHGRFYIMNLSEGGRMRSGVLDHEYSFSPEEAETWLDTHA
jgi:hypothetical protein